MGSTARPVPVPQVLPKSTTFCPCWPCAAVIAVNTLAERLSGSILRARVEGHTTPAVADIGAASLRIRFCGKTSEDSCEEASAPLQQGGYLLAIRFPALGQRFLPAVAGVPGSQGLDRQGCSRVGLAECCIIARPVTDGTATLLPDSVLQDWAPLGTNVDIVPLARVTDFFLGLNAGTWLRIRIDDICSKGRSWISSQEHAGNSGVDTCWLSDTGLCASAEVGPGIPDSSEAFQYWGGSGNAGVSGQVIRLAPDMAQEPAE